MYGSKAGLNSKAHNSLSEEFKNDKYEDDDVYYSKDDAKDLMVPEIKGRSSLIEANGHRRKVKQHSEVKEIAVTMEDYTKDRSSPLFEHFDES